MILIRKGGISYIVTEERYDNEFKAKGFVIDEPVKKEVPKEEIKEEPKKVTKK